MIEYYLLKINNRAEAKNQRIYNVRFDRFIYIPFEEISDKMIKNTASFDKFCIFLDSSETEIATVEMLKGNIVGKIILDDEIEIHGFTSKLFNIHDLETREFINAFEYTTRVIDR